MKTITEMAREAEIGDSHGYIIANELAHLERFAELVRADKNEACAKVCESMRTYVDRHNAVIQSSATDCAAAIRARGNT